jgi:hypothetical protein
MLVGWFDFVAVWIGAFVLGIVVGHRFLPPRDP